MKHDLSRRELILRGAFAGAALTVPGFDAMAAVRERKPKRSVHCLPAADRFRVDSVVRDAEFLTWSPNGQLLALETSRGIEVHNYADGSRKTVTGPGFKLTADAWHRSGTLFLASGPAEDGTGPYIHAIDPASGAVVRLLQDYPGTARAACFSPDGRKVAFTYVNRYIHQICMADWSQGQLANPLLLIPFNPATEPLIDKFQNGMSWYETRGFSANGQRLYFASDRTSGMLNINVHYIELATAKRHRVTADQGVVEGLVISNDDSTVYFSGTRARESGYLTLVTGPAVPPLLSFVAEPTLHATLAKRFLAPIGNGDVLAVDETYGMGARMVGERGTLVEAVGSASGIENWLYRTIACSMSPDGRHLAVAAISSAGSDVVLLRRPASGVPKPVRVRRTLGPRGAVPLPKEPFADLDRTFTSEFGGQAHVQLQGTLEEGSFRADLDNFNADGVRVMTGPIEFLTSGGNFHHDADIVRLDYDETEEANTFYKSAINVNWEGDTSGFLDSRSRHGTTSAAWDGTTFAKVAPWRAGRRTPEPIPGSKKCPDTGRT